MAILRDKSELRAMIQRRRLRAAGRSKKQSRVRRAVRTPAVNGVNCNLVKKVFPSTSSSVGSNDPVYDNDFILLGEEEEVESAPSSSDIIPFNEDGHASCDAVWDFFEKELAEKQGRINNKNKEDDLVYNYDAIFLDADQDDDGEEEVESAPSFSSDEDESEQIIPQLPAIVEARRVRKMQECWDGVWEYFEKEFAEKQRKNKLCEMDGWVQD